MEHEHTAADSLVILLTHISHNMGRVFSKQVGVSVTRMELLHEVWHAGEIRQTELTQRLSIDGALIARFVKQMEADHLISRRVDPRTIVLRWCRLVRQGWRRWRKCRRWGMNFKRSCWRV